MNINLSNQNATHTKRALEAPNRINDLYSKSHAFIDSLIVSDVHMGSSVTRAGELYTHLNSYMISDHKYLFRRLILLGDIFDSMNFRRLRKYEWKILGLIRKMTHEKSKVEVVWVRGNHDLELIELMEHMVGVNVYEEYHWQVGGLNFLAMHGDQFDKWVLIHPLLVDIPIFIYETIQKLDGAHHTLSRFLKDKSKKWLRINEDVARGIIEYARGKYVGINGVFCGHTHLADATYFKDKKVWYYNSGCWTGKEPPTYITVGQDGSVSLEKYIEQHPNKELIDTAQLPVLEIASRLAAS